MTKVKTLRLSDVRGLLHKTAAALIKKQGFYTCTVNGIKTRIIAD